MSFLSKILTVINPVAGILVSKSEAEKNLSNQAKQALAAIRGVMPGPDKCNGSDLLPVYVGSGNWNRTTPCGDRCTYIARSIDSMKLTLSDWHIPRGEQHFVDAYNIVINEYTDYYNKNCVAAPAASDAGTVTDTAATGTPGAGSTANTSTVATKNVVTPEKKDNTKLILIVTGISVVLVAAAIIIKKRMK